MSNSAGMPKTSSNSRNSSKRSVCHDTGEVLGVIETGVKVSFRSRNWTEVGAVAEIMYRPVVSVGVVARRIFWRVEFSELAVRDTWLDPFEYDLETNI